MRSDNYASASADYGSGTAGGGGGGASSGGGSFTSDDFDFVRAASHHRSASEASQADTRVARPHTAR